MKRITGNFLLQSGKDFPLDCELFSYLDGNTALTAVLGNIAGDKTIIAGCEPEQNGTKRKAGYVFLKTKDYPDGEIIYFEGGTVASGMYVKQEFVPVSMQGYDYPQAYTVRCLSPGIGEENYDWADFRKLKTNRELAEQAQAQDAAIAAIAPPPLGLVYPWAGDVAGGDIPQNYMLCDGTRLLISDYRELYAVIGRLHTPESTPAGYFCLPDLRSRFVVGYSSMDADYNAIAKTGGEKKHALTVDELPSHTHGQNLWAGASGDWKSGGRNSYPNATSLHDQTAPFGRTESEGKNAAHENRPPYYTLAYVMRVK